MLNRIAAFLRGLEDKAEPVADSDDRLSLAAAALLVEAARMDDSIDAAERARIVELVRWRFGLTEDEAESLVAEAEDATEDAAHWYRFTATIRGAFDDEERIQLIEMLWDVAYADGRLHDLEASLLRRIAGLLYVSDRDSGAARQRAMRRHGVAPD
jgi:uncharacterized tellurite resistance protein B-like protein